MAETQLPLRDWMTEDRVRQVFAALTRGGAAARFVGGCVRDGLLGRPVSDVDIATTALPETVMALAADAGLKPVATGIEHGTVTLIVDGRGFEVTTLREDVETDGRRAVVAYTDDWRTDASRRDFTINAMSATPDGELFDYFGGGADLEAGHVRFVGDPTARIAEDVLRLLRFYRMHAWYGQGAADDVARAACRAQAAKLPGLSVERVREELLKTLRAPDPAPVFRMMAEDEVLVHGLPAAGNIDRLAALAELEDAVLEPANDPLDGADAIRRLSALLSDDTDIAELAEGLRLSNRDARRLADMAAARDAVVLDGDARTWRRQLHTWGVEGARDVALLAAAGQGAGASALDRFRKALADWQPQTLPVKGADLIAAGVPEGPAVGVLMRALNDFWIAEDFQPDRTALLTRAAELQAKDETGGGV